MFTLEDNFDKAMVVVFAHEGGYSDSPSDPGGPTNFGISTKFIKDNNLDFDIKELTKDEAKLLYREYFWDPHRFSAITNSDFATKIFDTAVNIGPLPAIKIAQRVLMHIYEPMLLDGIIGHQTLEALNHIVDANFFMNNYRDYLQHYYYDLVIRNPKLEPNLVGWLKRAKS